MTDRTPASVEPTNYTGDGGPCEGCGVPRDDHHIFNGLLYCRPPTSGEPSTNLYRVLDNMLRHHNATTDHGSCEFSREAVVALSHEVEARATPPALDAARSEIQANRAQGVQWDPPVNEGVQRWYAEGYDRGLRDADAILARLSASGEQSDD